MKKYLTCFAIAFICTSTHADPVFEISVVKPQPTCGTHEHAENYVCVADPQPICPTGQRAENYVCIADNNPGVASLIYGYNYVPPILASSVWDKDGTPLSTAITYKWFRNGVATANTNPSYTLTSSDAGTKIHFTAAYIDKANNNELVTSPAISCTTIIRYTPTGPVDVVTCS
jgi:hypothetical protein